MSNPYSFYINDLMVVVYASTKADAEKKFSKSMKEHDAQIRTNAIDGYKEQLLEYLIPLKDKYFDLAKGTKMPERYMHLKRMDTVDMIIEAIKVKAEQLKEQKNEKA